MMGIGTLGCLGYTPQAGDGTGGTALTADDTTHTVDDTTITVDEG